MQARRRYYLYRETVSETVQQGTPHSKIIPPQLYNTLLSKQHPYFRDADLYIAERIPPKVTRVQHPEILDIGCGPGCITPLVYQRIPNAKLYGLDTDQGFIDYAKAAYQDLPIQWIHCDINTYKHHPYIDLAYSQGFHHHRTQDVSLEATFRSVFNLMKKRGYYIVGDEFIPDFINNEEREVNLILLHSHIIAYALKYNFEALAQEEAQTLLDDIYGGREHPPSKNKAQIDRVLKVAPLLNSLIQEDNLTPTKKRAKAFLEELETLQTDSPSEDSRLSLSRTTFKVSQAQFVAAAEKAGLFVKEFKPFGPPSEIGCIGVYTLRKL
jgi:SAM-dependent methyltransferase